MRDKIFSPLKNFPSLVENLIFMKILKRKGWLSYDENVIVPRF